MGNEIGYIQSSVTVVEKVEEKDKMNAGPPIQVGGQLASAGGGPVNPSGRHPQQYVRLYPPFSTHAGICALNYL